MDKGKDWGACDGISSIKFAEKVRLFSKRTIACLCHVFLRSNRIVFSLKILACFRFRSNIFTLITCPVNCFSFWDKFSVQKSVIWVVFGKQMLIIRNAISSVAISNGSQI